MDAYFKSWNKFPRLWVKTPHSVKRDIRMLRLLRRVQWSQGQELCVSECEMYLCLYLHVQNVSISVSMSVSTSVPDTSGCYEWTIILDIVTVNFSEILCRPGKLPALSGRAGVWVHGPPSKHMLLVLGWWPSRKTECDLGWVTGKASGPGFWRPWLRFLHWECFKSI